MVEEEVVGFDLEDGYPPGACTSPRDQVVGFFETRVKKGVDRLI